MIVVYGLFTADEYELPVVYADSLKELSFLSGFPLSTLFSAMVRGSCIGKKYKVEKILLEDVNEKA